ncbi:MULTISPECIES: mechanosensitive ion channel family protein [Ramlibacter]|uniref:Mechanosensitive ion channel n=1 Tax=Ramlibacter pinisoli TaxID=2682844 RepID=A0A6N8IS15_9BURK|nr:MULTISPECIES: mechanosensitive ion channel domain-containing protein [Ramlibacter]MBA2963707.1 mechanosensitive ion channel [Ramlibacter sp. CGMCC 1.13660]MVQ28673.1 mechanosensitive ion channel [Ramlibacter pinisoli]
MGTLDQLVHDLGHPGMPVELAVLLGCLLSAGGISWLIGRRQSAESVWFGRATVDGLLFPLLALVLTYAARHVVEMSQPVVLLRLAIPVLVSLAGIRFLARVLTLAFPASGFARLMERLFSWLAWIAAALWAVGVLPAVRTELDEIRFVFGKSRVSLLNILDGTLAAGVVLIAALWISAVLERQVLRQAVHDLSLRKVAANAIRAALLLVGVLFALSTAGVDLTALSVLGGAIGVGLGFGLQKLAANYVSGFVILFERSLRIGDTVRVDGFEGQVIDIKTRYTLIRALNGRESIVPNEKLITERIENLSLADPRVLLSTEVAVAYDSDVDQVQRLLQEAALATARVLQDPGPAARLVKFGADGLEFSLFFWIADPANGQGNVRSDVNLEVLRRLRAAGIEIPYPQREVRILGGGGAASLL